MENIYCITNQINGKKYVGRTNNSIENRFSQHKRARFNNDRKKHPIYHAIKKYGKENFEIELLEKTEFGSERETYWISKLDTYRSGYNATIGGEGTNRVDKKKEEKIIRLYQQYGNYVIVAEETGLHRETVKKYVKINNVEFIGNKTINGVPTYLVNDDKWFRSITNFTSRNFKNRTFSGVD